MKQKEFDLKDKKTDIHQIIKYDPYREYVGEWSPKKIQNKYHEIYEHPFRPWSFVSIGRLSSDVIIDAIWNEMSYNQLRFGETNLFNGTDIKAIKKFCKKYNKTDENGNRDITAKIAYKLSSFMYFIGKSNPEFYSTGAVRDDRILIKCDYNRKPSEGYKALACLVNIIHLIASQNLQDYKIKAYRKKINEVASTRHPNLQRNRKYFNFVGATRIANDKESLAREIMQKTTEISDTEMRIKTLSEYEPPVDTSNERKLLSQQQSEFQILSEKFEYVKNQYDRMFSEQNVIEKE